MIGIEPLLCIASRYQVPWEVSEVDFAGTFKGEPMNLIRGKYTGLPIPADAEVALDAEVSATEKLLEGPFGEWHGYYAEEEKRNRS